MNTQPSYFQSYPDPFYEDWKTEPVPGWGVRPVMAGPRMIAVGQSLGTQAELQHAPFYRQRWFIPAVGVTAAGLLAVFFLLKRK